MNHLLEKYLEASKEEKELIASILGKSHQQIQREIEVEMFYDSQDGYAPTTIEYVFFDPEPAKLTIQYYVTQPQPLHQQAVRYSRPTERTIVFYQDDICKNKKLLDIIRRWDNIRASAYAFEGRADGSDRRPSIMEAILSCVNQADAGGK